MSDNTQFMGAETAADDAKFWVIPGLDDSTGLLRTGQSGAPAEIIAASQFIPFHDEEVAVNVCKTAPICTVEGGDSETIRAAFEAAFDVKAIPVIFGGTPAITLPGLQTLADKTDEFTILHITPRANLRDVMSGSATGQTVMRTAIAMKNLKRIVQVGTTALHADENEIIFSDDSKIEPFFACDIARAEDESWHEDVIQELASPVYLSIDVSALSRSVVPNVAIPEPGGLEWWPLLRLLKKVCSRRRIAAFDIVNMVPDASNQTGAYSTARLAYKIMAYIVAGGKML